MELQSMIFALNRVYDLNGQNLKLHSKFHTVKIVIR